MPSSKRPPLMTSIVDDSFAVSAGLRNPVQTTMWPRRTRSVAIASAESTENDSKVISSVGSGTVWKWSKTQSDSKPSASACSASSTVRAQASAGGQPSYSPFQPWGAINPTCIRSSLRWTVAPWCRSDGRTLRAATRRVPWAGRRRCRERPILGR